MARGLRIIEATREIGVLLMAFSPLDVAPGSKPVAESARVLAGFLLIAIVLFSLASTSNGGSTVDSVFIALGALLLLGLIGYVYARLSIRNEAKHGRSGTRRT